MQNAARLKATRVRAAQITDAPQAAQLLATLGYLSSVAQVERRITQSVESSETAVFVAVTDGQAVGLASFHRIPMFHAEGYVGRITSFIVAQSHRKRGVGRTLAAAVEEYAWSHGCTRVEVTSGDHRPDAHAFYEQLGYKIDCRRFIKHNGVRTNPRSQPGRRVADINVGQKMSSAVTSASEAPPYN